MARLKTSAQLWIVQIVRRAHIDEHDLLLLQVAKEHVLRLQVSMDEILAMHLLHLEAYVLEHETCHALLQEAKGATMRPHLITTLEHFCEEVQLELILERGHEFDARAIDSILVAQLVQSVLLHEDVRFPFHVHHLRNLGNL